MPPAIRYDALLLRLLKDVNDIRSALRRVTVNLPLYDIANENTPAQLTGSQNNYIIGNYDILRLSSTGTYVITGMRGGVKGRRLQVFNVGSYTLAFPHQNTLSDAENRFKFNTGLPAFVEPGQNITFYYDATQSRWIEATNVFEYDIAAAWDTQSVPAGTWRGLTWSENLGLLVAVAINAVITSPDGINWSSQTPAANLSWNATAWSPALSLFVAVASTGVGNRVMTSPDGVIWTIRTSAADNSWTAVAWSPELSIFAAIASLAAANQVMTSPNGIVWSPHTATNSNWTDIVWADALGLFVAVSASTVTNNIITSPDGIIWTPQTKVGTPALTSITWSPELGLLVAAGFDSTPEAVFYTSPDGINWTLQFTGTGTSGSPRVAWSDDYAIFLAATSFNYWSSDGITWGSGTGFNVNDIVYANTLGLFVAVGNNAAYTTP